MVTQRSLDMRDSDLRNLDVRILGTRDPKRTFL